MHDLELSKKIKVYEHICNYQTILSSWTYIQFLNDNISCLNIILKWLELSND